MLNYFLPLHAWLTSYILNYDLQLLWAMIKVLYIKERSFIFLLLGTTGLMIMLGVGSFWSNVWRYVFLTYCQIVAWNFFFLCQIIISYDSSCMIIQVHQSYVWFLVRILFWIHRKLEILKSSVIFVKYPVSTVLSLGWEILSIIFQ